jgi:hypothetical protein
MKRLQISDRQLKYDAHLLMMKSRPRYTASARRDRHADHARDVRASWPLKYSSIVRAWTTRQAVMGPSCEIGCCGRRYTGSTFVKLLPAMTEGDRAAVNGWHSCRKAETPKSAGDSARDPYGCGRLAGETLGPTLIGCLYVHASIACWHAKPAAWFKPV